MELLKLLGIVIVIAGFALKLDSILVILVAAVVTALVGGLGPVTLLETLGSTFVANRRPKVQKEVHRKWLSMKPCWLPVLLWMRRLPLP